MTDVIGRGVKVEMGKTYGSAKVVTAVTQASPGVATSTGHSLADGSAGYFAGVAGMVNLEGQAIRVDAPDANTFALQTYDTTQLAAFTAGNFFPVTAWSTIARAKSWSIGGGAASPLDSTVLLDVVNQQVPGPLAAQTVTLNLLAETYPSEAMQLLQQGAFNQKYFVFRITLADGSQRVFYGSPSLPGEDVQVGQLGTGSMSILTKGIVLFLPPIAA